MATPDREDIHIISRHSNLSAAGIRSALQSFVYSGKEAWQLFLKIFFLSLGAGFMIFGVIFFFAYNWNNLHKFVKLGIIEALIIGLTITALLIRSNPLIRKILLTAAAALVGVLFAVFGQVYQTGADAYDLFLNWTLCILLWVIVAEFAPLWLIWIALVNTTVMLWFSQRTPFITDLAIPLTLFLINTVCLIGTLLLKHLKNSQTPQWFIIVLTLAAATASTIGVCVGLFNGPDLSFSLLLASVITGYLAAIYYSFRFHSLFFLAVTGCSAIIMLSAGILNVSDSSGSVLFICVFLAASITMLILTLLHLQKKWSHEKTN